MKLLAKDISESLVNIWKLLQVKQKQREREKKSYQQNVLQIDCEKSSILIISIWCPRKKERESKEVKVITKVLTRQEKREREREARKLFNILKTIVLKKLIVIL